MAEPRRRSSAPDVAPIPIRPRAAHATAPIDLGVKTYKGAIYDALADMIAELELPPGDRLVEADLVGRFHVSKTPIREALLLLEADSLVELVPYSGARVTWMSVDDWEEQLFIFDALEQPALARIADRIKPADIRTIEKLLARMQRLRDAHDSRAFAKTMWEVHRRLFAPTGYERLRRMILNEGRHIGRRYQRVFVHSFDDAWDLEFSVVRGRFEGIARHDPTTAAALVADGHAELVHMARQHVDDPLVAPYLDPASREPTPAVSRRA